jgi:hypothetical protein
MKLALTFFILGLSLGFSACGASDGLQIRVWTDKDQFLVYEPIPVMVEIKNISDSALFLNLGEVAEHLVIKDELDKGYGTRLKGSSIGGDRLGPDEIRHASLDICGQYGVRTPGEYSCHINLPPDPYFYPPRYGWTESNTITIKVVEPKGTEKEALNLFQEAEQLRHARSEAGGPDLAKKELGFLKYQELVDKYPETFYAPKALRIAIGAYVHSREHRRRVIPVCVRLIEQYPNSYYWGSGFSHLIGTYEVLKDKAGAIKTMQELIKKHPDTKIAQRASEQLEKIEKWEFD